MGKDIMNKNELHEYGINLMINYLEKNDFTIMEVNKDPDSCPQIITQKGTDMSFVLVETYMFPQKNVELNKDMVSFMKQTAQNYNAKCYAARVGLAWAGGENQKELGIPYKNADFLVKFNGLEEL